MKIERLPGNFAVCKISATRSIPDWATGPFVQLSVSDKECTIVCDQDRIPDDVETERDWAAFRFGDVLAFDMVGILAKLSQCLAEVEVSIFVVSTFDTDYVLVPKSNCQTAIEAMRAGGYTVIASP